jgi:uncharacterized membrane protein
MIRRAFRDIIRTGRWICFVLAAITFITHVVRHYGDGTTGLFWIAIVFALIALLLHLIYRRIR